MLTFGFILKASTYYVSINGVDSANGGSISNPWKTLAYAASRLPEGKGDTIQLGDGLFIETITTRLPIGVHITGNGINKTTVKWGGLSGKDIIQLITNSHVNGNQSLSHFKLDGNNKSAVKGIFSVGRDNIIIHDMYFTACSETGAKIMSDNTNTPAYYVTGFKVYDCTFLNTASPQSSNAWFSGALEFGGHQGADIYNLTINEDAGFGIKFLANGWFKGVMVHDCNITVPEANRIGTTQDYIAVELWNMMDTCKVYNITTNGRLSLENIHSTIAGYTKVYNNRIVTTNRNLSSAIEYDDSNGEIFKNFVIGADKALIIGNASTNSANNKIYNNVFTNVNIPSTFTSSIWVHAINSNQCNENKIYNNVLDANQRGIFLKAITAVCEVKNTQIKNNIFQNMVVEGIKLANVIANISGLAVFNNCSYNTPFLINSTSSIPGYTSGGNILGNPQLTNIGNKPFPFYKPLSDTSFVIDKGLNVGLPFFDSMPDIGCYEVKRGSSLPFSLLSFSGLYTNNSVLIRWRTSNQTEPILFVIERSNNNDSWIEIGSITAKNDSKINSYIYNDDAPADGINYYRLKIISKTGNFTYSPIQRIETDKKCFKLDLHPNPAKDKLFYSLSDTTYESPYIKVINHLGKTMLLLPKKKCRDEIDIHSLTKGVYYFQIADDKSKQQLTKAFVVYE